MNNKMANSKLFPVFILVISACLMTAGISSSRAFDEFQVNTQTQYEQKYSDIAMDGKGNFVIVW